MVNIKKNQGLYIIKNKIKDGQYKWMRTMGYCIIKKNIKNGQYKWIRIKDYI